MYHTTSEGERGRGRGRKREGEGEGEGEGGREGGREKGREPQGGEKCDPGGPNLRGSSASLPILTDFSTGRMTATLDSRLV